MKKNKLKISLIIVGILAVLFTVAVICLDIDLIKFFSNTTVILVIFVAAVMGALYILSNLYRGKD